MLLTLYEGVTKEALGSEEIQTLSSSILTRITLCLHTFTLVIRYYVNSKSLSSWMAFITLHVCVRVCVYVCTCVCVLDATLGKRTVVPEHGPWLKHLTFLSFSRVSECIPNCCPEKCILNVCRSAWNRVYLCMGGDAKG